MRRVDRATFAGPASLSIPGRTGPSELDGARAHYASGRKGTYPFRAYKGNDVRHALDALFHGKCAYCESRFDVTAPVDIEHFRPKGGVEGQVHPGYWWLAAEWTNLLPSCIDCNRRRYQPTPSAFASLSAGLDQARRTGFTSVKTGKETSFPISALGVRSIQEPAPGMLTAALAAEQCLLLDPCTDDPGRHLSFHIDRLNPLGIVYPTGAGPVVLPEPTAAIPDVERAARAAGLSERGAVSIQVYGLNRLALVQERTRVLRKLEFLGKLVVELSATADELEEIEVPDAEHHAVRNNAIKRLRAGARRAVAEIRSQSEPDAPFSEMAKAWIAVFLAEMAAAKSVRPTTPPPEPSQPPKPPACKPRGVRRLILD
ncbi:HNH endonuclease [Methylobacterium brachythecii]|uniref:Uncharacterized protein (TIGR02646 family) n=1 Tax=Methylobacterium brachythecii TaxID=1176177 RepID=A0A7W6AK35_9HYPH|nr:HNH endonuclease [Methylobacterium brachythecii]MBB3903941.1 uncharacterized protein (TIGR02646 family) [Methylobacterium brachythecii]GLS42688.1 hypothetical protein GCM10007884_06730 [Methylobacterium brachythecii]